MLADRVRKAWPYSRTTTTAALLFLAGIVFLVPGLGFTDALVFDEAHYVPVARHYAAGEFIDPGLGPDDPRPYNNEHPPLVKYLMGASVLLLGDNPVAWRLPNALMGAAGYAVAYLLGRNLFRSEGAGLAAAAFLALDPFYAQHAKIAMLETFPAVLAALAAALVLWPDKPRHLAAGISLGLAIASKYTTLLVAPAILILALWRQEGSWKDRLRTGGLHYVLVPGLVMIAVYLPYLVLWTKSHGPFFAIEYLPFLQWQMLTYGYGANLEHPSTSPPHEWFLFTVPLVYYWNKPTPATVQWMFTIGNPATWWPAVYAASMHFLPALYQGPRTFRDWDGLRIGAVLGVLTFLPYLLITRITFLWYAVQFTPLFAVLSAGLFWSLWRRPGILRFAAFLWLAIIAAHAALLYPIATAQTVGEGEIQLLFERGLPWRRHVPAPAT